MDTKFCSPARAAVINDMVDRAGWSFGVALLSCLMASQASGFAAGVLVLVNLAAYLFFIASVCAVSKAADASRSMPWLVIRLLVPVAGPVVGILEMISAKAVARRAPAAESAA